MNGLLLLAIAAALLLTAYLVYGRYLVKTWGIDPKAKTPAYEKEDGVDYVPSNKWEVFGHQFSSIAGAGPVTGPVLAMVLVSLSVFLKVTGRKGYMLYVPMVMMLVVTMTSLGMSVYNICLKLFVTGGFVFMTDGLQLFFAVLLMALGLMIFIGSGKKLVQPVEKAKLQEQEQNA